MNLSDVKTYLSGRIQTSDILALTDGQLTKYMNTSVNLLNVFYKFQDYPESTIKTNIVSEQMVFLFNGNIDLNLFYQYNGLTSFNIAGAVQGTVDYSKKGQLFSYFVKALLEDAGIEEKIQNPDSKVNNNFTWY